MTDIEILKAAYKREYVAPKTSAAKCFVAWESSQIGASRSDIIRLKEGLLIYVDCKLSAGINSLQKYRLTDKGINVVKGYLDENPEYSATADDVLESMKWIVGFEDIKKQIAYMVGRRERGHILMMGPPASGKSALMDAIRQAVPNSYMAFGNRTSAAGVADMLFLKKPHILFIDEVEKCGKDLREVMLGVMEGEIIETKSQKIRATNLNTQVIAACNSYDKFKPEFLSRWAFKPIFPGYTRNEFIEVTIAYLRRIKDYPLDIAALIGETVFDNQLGDVRECRGFSQMMTGPAESEVRRVTELKLKFGPGVKRQLAKSGPRMLI